MEKLIDFGDIKRRSIGRFIAHISLISLLSISIIVGSVLLLIYSNLDYFWNLFTDILLCSLLAIFLLFYFLNILPMDWHYFSYFRTINETAVEHRRRLVFLQEIESKDIDKIKHRVLQFVYQEGENKFVDNLYVLDSDISFTKGQSYKIDTYRNIIIRYEVI